MRLVVTGGGTGGHVYPALEVALAARERGAELVYLGSLRGQEGKLCEARGILFHGFPSMPLYSLRTMRGWKALSRLLTARGMAKKHLSAARPDVVFSTGGYSAAPILAASKALRIPYVIHESNSVPGRTNRMFGKAAKSFLSVFFATERFYTDRPVTRTGQPIRKELREAAAAGHKTTGDKPTLVVVGGSQGSAYLNEVVPQAIKALEMPLHVIHAAGPNNFAETTARVKALGIDDYCVHPYLETEMMVDAFQSADLAVCRSGGTLAELALFGLPSVLVPLPSSADAHQLHNAKEFAEMKAAVIAEQEPAPFAATVEAIRGWLKDESGRAEASCKLKEWDVPNATDRIVAHVEAAAK